jgi:hypothetical protein
MLNLIPLYLNTQENIIVLYKYFKLIYLFRY